MHLERLLQLNLATLTTLGVLLLGMGQRSVAPPLLVAVAAAVSIWVTDIRGIFRLGRNMANVLLLAAAVISLRQFYPITSELQTLNFAWFLIFMQTLFFFQEKDERKYWLLVMFSLLQTIVATLFSQGVWFGVLLTVYMLLGFSAMTLLHLYKQQTSQQSPEEGGVAEPWLRFTGLFRRKVGRRLAETAVSGREMKESRWPLLGQTAEIVGQPTSDDREGLGRNLFNRLGRLALYTAALTAVIFFTLPRFGQTTWHGVSGNPQEMVGYSDTVELGELGQAIENPQRVMTVRFFDRATNNHQPINSEIYLQGALLMNYEWGRWQTGLPSWDMRAKLLELPDQMPARYVCQEIAIVSMDHEELFFVAPFVPLDSTHEMTFDYSRQRLLRFGQLRERQFGYKLGTTAIVQGQQMPVTPSNHRDAVRRTLQFPEKDGVRQLPHLTALAKRWIDESDLPEADRCGRARYLERKFLTSGQFEYSLVGQPRDQTIDPIEDFVTQHPRGHCEYFASALTLMLRSQKIPARMVVGYKCDEWNPESGSYQVRQLHAHTWVEVFLPFEQIPTEFLHGRDYWPWEEEGGWLRLDPTPGGFRASSEAGSLAPVGRALDWLDSIWAKYVVELDYQRQREAIYEPVATIAKAMFDAVTDRTLWRNRFQWLAALLCVDESNGMVAWLVVLAALAVGAMLTAAAGWLAWRAGRLALGYWRGNRPGARHARRVEVEFYHRFETILARQGFVRGAGQTQRDFAALAGLDLAKTAGKPQLASLAAVVAEAFYRVRFGRQPLDSLQVEKVEHALVELAAAAENGDSRSKSWPRCPSRHPL